MPTIVAVSGIGPHGPEPIPKHPARRIDRTLDDPSVGSGADRLSAASPGARMFFDFLAFAPFFGGGPAMRVGGETRARDTRPPRRRRTGHGLRRRAV